MKTNNIIIVLFFISIIQITNAQILPIEKIVEVNKTIYNTNQFTQIVNAYKNQPYDLKQKLEIIKIADNTNNNFIKNCVNSTTYTLLQNNNARIFIDFVCNQNGNVLACRFIIYKTDVTLSNNEIECVLNEAIKNKFSFSNIPDGINNFYMMVRKRFHFKNQISIKPPKDPDLPEDQY